MKQFTLKTLMAHLNAVAIKKPDLLDKKIIISDDMEGNGYHGLFYGICGDGTYADGMITDSETYDINELIILG